MYGEYLGIYFTNLSTFYILSWSVTAVVLFSTWWFEIGKLKREDHGGANDSSRGKVPWVEELCDGDEVQDEVSCSSIENVHSESKQLVTESLSPEQSLLRRYKAARQLAIEEQLTAGLSNDQLVKERQVEEAQLAAIFNLLKEQEEQFQITSMDELQDQMKKLYRA